MSVETKAFKWVEACSTGDIDEDDVIRFDHEGESYAVYRLADGYYATDGWCTHEQAHLADGFVLAHEIECPLHQGRFDILSGEPKSPPVCIRLKTYPVRVENGKVMLGIAPDDA
jgi:3-phenylpropionate/trans-cinnamate dioxygenase ferredoxin subunit